MHSFWRTLHTALHSLRRHILQAILTCLGIVIGVAAVIAMIEIGQGTSFAIQETITSLGANIVQLDPSDVIKAGVSSGKGGKVTLTPQDCEAILRECDTVRWAAPSVDCRAQVIYGHRNWSPQNILGTTADYLVLRNWNNLAEGEMLTANDVRSAARVCLVGQTIVRELFEGASPLGKEIRIKNIEFRVIGVLSRKGANMMGRDQDDFIIAPWTTVKFRLTGARQTNTPTADTSSSGVNTLNDLYPSQAVQFYPLPSAAQVADMPLMSRFADIDDIWVSVNSQEDIPLAIKQITVLLRERHHLDADQPDDFRIRNLTEISETLASTQRLITTLLLCVALISLVVGGVGIMNIMLASVTERTREIGLRMAVGARARDILRQFLTEAVLLCLLGGAGGIMLGRGASLIVTSILHWRTVMSVPAIAAAVGVSAAVGVLFGFYPAWRASRFDPIVALRFE